MTECGVCRISVWLLSDYTPNSYTIWLSDNPEVTGYTCLATTENYGCSLLCVLDSIQSDKGLLERVAASCRIQLEFFEGGLKDQTTHLTHAALTGARNCQFVVQRGCSTAASARGSR